MVAETMLRIGRQMQLLVGLALMSAAGAALADGNVSETVVVVSTTQGAWNCNEAATREQAHSLAEKASQEGSYRKAGECYLVAGEQHLANEAFVKASAQTSGDTSRRLAANISDVKAQARQMKQAFQRR